MMMMIVIVIMIMMMMMMMIIIIIIDTGWPTMALGSAQPLTEMSTRHISW
jgi:hypothetical protein